MSAEAPTPMLPTEYRYVLEGSGADGQTFKCEGVIECVFPVAYQHAMQDSFTQLTQGKAQYGQPGKGCNGPYRIKRLLIEVREQ